MVVILHKNIPAKEHRREESAARGTKKPRKVVVVYRIVCEWHLVAERETLGANLFKAQREVDSALTALMGVFERAQQRAKRPVRDVNTAAIRAAEKRHPAFQSNIFNLNDLILDREHEPFATLVAAEVLRFRFGGI